jgi:hypothetical protein
MKTFALAAVHVAMQAAATVDTVWVQAASRHQTWFERVTGVASGLVTITIMVIAIALVPAAWNFRRTYQKTARILDRLQGEMGPLMRHARVIAENAAYVSTAVREDAGMIHRTLGAANKRLEQAAGLAERRLNEFNALLDVVQQEAEGVFLSTAATVHGVRHGASHLVGDDGPELASDESDDDDPEAAVNGKETDDGNYDFIAGSDDDPDTTRAPRIIRGTRARR